MMREFGAVVGKRPRIIPVPVLTPELSARWLSLITTVPANIARALIGGLKHDIPADDAALRRIVPQTAARVSRGGRGGAAGRARRTPSRRAGPRAG